MPLIVLIVLGLAAGCGGGSTSASDDTSATTTDAGSATTAGDGSTTTTGGVSDACSLLTPVDIDAALQVAVGSQQFAETGRVQRCAYESADLSTTVIITRQEPVGDLMDNARAGLNATDLSGVGDEAVIAVEGGTIAVRVGEIGFIIEVDPPPSQEALVQLGRTAVGHA